MQQPPAPLEVLSIDPPDHGAPIFKVDIESRLEAGDATVGEAMDVLRSRHCFAGPTSDFRAWLCLEELVTNALRHGNRLDPAKRCTVSLFLDDGRWIFRVEDQGAGFDPARLPDPREQLNDGGGRGIFLVRSLALKLAYYCGGRCAEIEMSVEREGSETVSAPASPRATDDN